MLYNYRQKAFLGSIEAPGHAAHEYDLRSAQAPRLHGAVRAQTWCFLQHQIRQRLLLGNTLTLFVQWRKEGGNATRVWHDMWLFPKMLRNWTPGIWHGRSKL